MNLGITVCATKGYAYAVMAQAVAVQINIREYERIYGKLDEVNVILVSDGNEKMVKLANWYSGNLSCRIHHIVKAELDDNVPNYKHAAQSIIAKMRTSAFNKARALNCDFVWSLDSDVIPRGNSLHCMKNTLDFDDGYYGIASCPYPSQGGGPLLYGFGDGRRWIYPNIYLDELEVPKAVAERRYKISERVRELEIKLQRIGFKEFDQKELGELKVLHKKAQRWDKRVEKKYPPKGNIHSLNGMGYRKRGWEPYSIGKGAIVESHWFGYGCLLLNKKVLNLVNFNGYSLEGTEDLFSYHEILAPHGVKIGAILHCPASHVIRVKEKHPVKEGEAPKEDTISYVQCLVYFELDGDCEGHIRHKRIPFIEFNE